MANSDKILFCVMYKNQICLRKGKQVVGPFALMKRALKMYRGAKLVRYHGQDAYQVR